MKCLAYKIPLSLLLCGLLVWWIVRSACTYATHVKLSPNVEIIIKSHTEKYGGAFASRSIDIEQNGKKLRRIWFGPMPSRTGVTGLSVALCRGKNSDYIAFYDEDAFWVLSLAEPREDLRNAFPEKEPPSILAEYTVSDFGNIVPMAKNFSFWVERVNRKRSLLE